MPTAKSLAAHDCGRFPGRTYAARTLLWVVWAAGLALLPHPAAALPDFAAEHDLHVELDPAAAKLHGRDRIHLSGSLANRVTITLNASAILNAVKLGGSPAVFDRQGALIHITCGDAHASGSIDLYLDWTCTFADPAPEMPVNTDNPGYGVSGTISPRGTLLLGGAGWYPAVSGAHEAFNLKVDAPAGIRAVTAGQDLGTTTTAGATRSHWRIAKAVEAPSLSAGPYQRRTAASGSLRAATYFLQDDTRLADDYLQATLRYLALYSARFGPYAFESFAVVENFFPTGYGFPSYTLIGGRVLRLPFIIETSLGHEIAHCWWGNGVRVDYREGNWSEGLTSYVAEHRYQEQRGEEAARAHRLQLLRNYTVLVPPDKDFPLARFTQRTDPVTMAIGYDKAAMVFHMLRRAVGEEAFWAGLRQVYQDQLFQRASWQTFLDAFRRQGGQELDGFLAQWVDQPGAPLISLAALTRRQTPAGAIVSGRIHQEETAFTFPLRLRLSSDDRQLLATITVSGARTRFEIPVDFLPQRLEADPSVDLMRRLHNAELPPTVNRLKAATDLAVVLPDPPGDAAERTIARILLEGLGREDAPLVTLSELQARGAKERNLIFMQAPHLAFFQRAAAGRLTTASRAAAFRGQPFDTQHQALFAVFPHPDDPAKVVAAYIGGQPPDRQRVAAKIPHYGRYSYLMFTGTTNSLKGVWPVEASPLIFTWAGSAAATAH
jgi:hypothetical protein